jgi:hypothetical protein
MENQEETIRHWLITWTCYGTRLPGAAAGFVGNVRESDGTQVTHNVPGTPCDADMPLLEAYVRRHMSGSPVQMEQRDAEAMIRQYQETARIRGWILQAASVMVDHTHVVISVPGDPDPQSILETLKSWATRALKKHRPIPANGTYWTAKGSRRKLPGDQAVREAVIYVVEKQPNPLAVLYAPDWQQALDEYRASQNPYRSG